MRHRRRRRRASTPRDKDFCDIYHATDADYAAKIHYWTTPQKQCVDGSGNNCTTYDEWVDKWQQIKG